MLSFKSLTDRNFLPALTLYNEATQRGEQYNCTLDEKGFIQLFLTPAKPGDAYFALYESSERGFIIGHFDGGMKKFFLTTVQVAPAHRRQGIGSALINALAEEMQRFASAHDLPDPEPEISYYNPTMIRWTIPGTEGHYHNNAQGVLLGSSAHLFFKNNGFRDTGCENTYYQRLDRYEWPTERMAVYEERVAKAGYTIEWYDASRHTDADGLLEDLNNALWSRQIPQELSREGGPRPLPILSDHGKMAGFAGPIVVEETGRAWFLGVAVHSRCRGCGAATLLFNRMSLELKKAGAIYLCFFTNENNFARNIYEGAGFRIYASWATMRRTKHH